MAKKPNPVELEMKLKLERLFKPDIKRLFARQIERFKSSVASRGVVPEPLVKPWGSALLAHYGKVRKSFISRVDVKSLACLETKQNEDAEELDAAILAALLAWEDEHSEQQAEYITDTNTRDMRDAVAEARAAMSEGGEAITNASLAVTAAAILKRKFRSRVDTIAITETQTPAETVKATSATMASAAAIEETFVIKTWRTMGDSVVRQTHRAANRQRRRLSQAFDVGGARLMFPGDTSLGAPTKEWIKCRCSAEYSRVSRSVFESVGF